MTNESFETELAASLKSVMMEDTFLLTHNSITSRMFKIVAEFAIWNKSFLNAEKLSQLLKILNSTNFKLDEDDIVTIIIPSNMSQSGQEFFTSPADLMSSCAIFKFQRTNNSNGYCSEFHYYEFNPDYLDKRVDCTNNGAFVSTVISMGQIPLRVNVEDRG